MQSQSVKRYEGFKFRFQAPSHSSKRREYVPVVYRLLTVGLVTINLFVKMSGDENWTGLFYLNMILNLQSKSLYCS